MPEGCMWLCCNTSGACVPNIPWVREVYAIGGDKVVLSVHTPILSVHTPIYRCMNWQHHFIYLLEWYIQDIPFAVVLQLHKWCCLFLEVGNPLLLAWAFFWRGKFVSVFDSSISITSYWWIASIKIEILFTYTRFELGLLRDVRCHHNSI